MKTAFTTLRLTNFIILARQACRWAASLLQSVPALELVWGGLFPLGCDGGQGNLVADLCFLEGRNGHLVNDVAVGIDGLNRFVVRTELNPCITTQVAVEALRDIV